MIHAGDRIGDWIIVQPLGAGGMGSIFLARSVLSDRVRAACKVMHARDGVATRERFIREVDTLASLNHPAVVRVLSGGDDPARGLLYLFMEYLEGEDLRSRLSRGPLSMSEAYNVFRQIGSGLQHAHQKGVTHRDLKPANIMLGTDGSARLVDFGIAAAEGRTSLTREGTLPGTLPYIDPTAFSGEKPDFKLADIYALGLVLWESLSGRMAFPEESDSSAGQQMVRMMRMKMESEAFDPGPGFPDPLRRLVMRATEPETDKRLGSMDEFLAQLVASFTGRPEISAQSTGEAVKVIPVVGGGGASGKGFGGPASVAELWRPKGPATGSQSLSQTSPSEGPSAGPASGVAVTQTIPMSAGHAVPVTPAEPKPAEPKPAEPKPASATQGAGGKPPPPPPLTGPRTSPTGVVSTSSGGRSWVLVLGAMLALMSCAGVGVFAVVLSSLGGEDSGGDVIIENGDNNAVFNPFQVDVNIPNPVVTTMSTDASAAADTARMGERKTFGPYKLTVEKVRRKKQLSHEVFRHSAPDGWDLLLVALTLENTSPGEVSLMSPFALIDYHPYQFSQSVACQLALEDGLESILSVPGRGKVKGEVCFEVASDATGLKLRFQPDMMNTSWNLIVALDR